MSSHILVRAAAVLPYLALALWLLVVTICIVGTIVIYKRFTSKPQVTSSRIDSSLVPPVSILRPLKGVDCSLKENLVSTFKLNYPKYELVLLVADEDDPAIDVVKALCKEYPDVDARLIVGAATVGVNPKVNNLIKGYDSSKYDIIWILDSNIYVEPDTLARAVDQLCKPNVGLVHHLPVGTRPQTLGSQLEEAFMNTAHARLYVGINALNLASCIVGKSNLFRKSHLKHIGGLSHFGKFISEDNILGQEIMNQGLKHVMASDLAYQPLGSLSVVDYLKRRSRWTRIRKHAVPHATIIEVFSESIGCSICGAYAFSRLFDVSPYAFFFSQMLIWFLADTMIYYVLHSGPSLYSVPKFVASWFLREFTALHVYLYAVAGSTVEWRGALYNLNRDGTVVLSKSQKLNVANALTTKLDLSHLKSTASNLLKKSSEHSPPSKAPSLQQKDKVLSKRIASPSKKR